MQPSIEYIILNAKNSNGVGTTINVEEFDHVVFSFATDGGGTAALKVSFAGSIQDTAPDFSAAKTKTNMWDVIQVKDLEDGSAIDGDVGVSVATADDYRLFEANVNGLKYLNAIVSALTAGNVTVKARLFKRGNV